MNFRPSLKAALFAAVSSLVFSNAASSQDVGSTPDTTGGTTTTSDPVVTEDAPDESDAESGPGVAVSAEARALKDTDGSRPEAARKLKTTALTNNPGFQSAVDKRNAKANKDDDSGAAGDQPSAEDHPGNDDHPGADDHPDADNNPGDVASEDHGRPDDLPGADDHPGRPGGG